MLEENFELGGEESGVMSLEDLRDEGTISVQSLNTDLEGSN